MLRKRLIAVILGKFVLKSHGSRVNEDKAAGFSEKMRVLLVHIQTLEALGQCFVLVFIVRIVASKVGV